MFSGYINITYHFVWLGAFSFSISASYMRQQVVLHVIAVLTGNQQVVLHVIAVLTGNQLVLVRTRRGTIWENWLGLKKGTSKLTWTGKRC